jgi:xylulokinase
MTALLGLDIGTTTIKSVLYETDRGRVTAVVSRPTPVDHPRPDWSEHDPQRLWETIAGCLREAATAAPIHALGVSSFAEAGLPLDPSGNPLHPIIAWYDRRCEPQVAWWESRISAAELHAITGQRVSTSLGVNKFLWIKQTQPDLIRRMTSWLSVPDYLLWRLTGEKVTDYSIASRTMLFDQRNHNWSPRMLELAGLRPEQLPRTAPGGTVVGYVSEHAARETGLPAGIPCVLGGHDHLCAALACGGDRPGSVIDSNGTAEAVLMVLDAYQSSQELAEMGFAVYAHVLPGRYVLKAGLKASGGAIDWLVELISDPKGPTNPDVYAKLEQEASAGIGKRIGPLWLPHFMGSGTPEGDRYSRAALIGLQIEHTRGDVFRGLVESLAFWLRQNLEVVHSFTGQAVQQVVLVGGVTRLEILDQIKADVLNLPVRVSQTPEASAVGAALLAGLGAGVFQSPGEAIGSLDYPDRMILPNMERVSWYKQMYERDYQPLYPALKDIHHRLVGFK